MDISVLPQEIVEVVANYLSLNDILSCCLVNSTWRQIFNDNRIWFNLCSKRSPVHFDKFSLIEEVCSVVPRFEFLNPKCGVLEPVCKWRERFMQEAHLTRNWRHGRHSKHIIIDYLEDGRDDYNFSNIQCEGNFTLIPYSERREFYVYKTEEKPLLTQIIKYSLDYMIEHFFRLSDSRLVIVQCNLLQIYEISVDYDYVILSHVFLFDSPQSASLNIPKVDTSSWYKSNIGLYPCEVSIASDFNGQYFIGIIYDIPIKNPHFHIWDIQNGHKIGVEYLPSLKFPVSDISFTIFKLNLFILVTFFSSSASSKNTIYRYNLNNFEFSPTSIEFNYAVPYVLFSDKYIINVDRKCKNLYFWDHNSGELACNMPCKNRLNILSLSVFNNYLIYAENVELSSVVRLVPLADLNSFSELNVSFNVSNISMVRDGMILVCVQMGLLLLDLSNSSILTVLEYDECLWSNPSSSKIVTKALDGLYLLSFW